MPKVSPEHLDARRAQILEAAKRCFARSGYAATTMSDIFRESGLSAGAVYRYFPSKEALLHAVYEAQVADHEGAREYLMGSAARQAELRGVFRQGLAIFDDPALETEARLPVMVHPESLRDPAIRDRAAATHRATVEAYRAVVERLQADGLVDPALDAEYVCWAAMCLFEGWRVFKTIAPDLDSERFGRAFEALLSGVFGPPTP